MTTHYSYAKKQIQKICRKNETGIQMQLFSTHGRTDAITVSPESIQALIDVLALETKS